MHPVNLGILAHVDAGKTSLTERLLYDTGVVGRLGSVDAGTTATDTGAIERRRGITIRSAVASFVVGDRRVNLVDTPGHVDFVAEVERALSVLDGAVLVLSAVEGVQPHTRVLMRTLRALRLPTLLFVNKIDRRGARSDDLVADVVRLLTPHVVPLGTVARIGTPAAELTGYRDDPAAWGPVLAEHDDALLAALVDGAPPTPVCLAESLRVATAAGAVHPLLFGSALSGAGIPALLDAIVRLLPPSPPAESGLRARVFAVERGAAGEKVAHVRSYGGELRERGRVTAYRQEPGGGLGAYRGRVRALEVVGGGDRLTAGHVARVRGLPDVRIGDQLGSPAGLADRSHFPPPTLETVVRPRRPEQAGALHAALTSLADQDPLIATRVTPAGESSVLLYGEVQKEVVGATLAEVYGVPAVFARSRLVHLERPVGVGHAVELIGQGFLATVGLRVGPGHGREYRIEVEQGSLLAPFHHAVEEAVGRALEQGVHGWPVTDVAVTLTHSGYWAPISTAAHFRDLTPHVLMRALFAAGTRVHEPCHRFDVEVPADRLGSLTAHLARLGARIDATTLGGRGRGGGPGPGGSDGGGDEITWFVTGEIPARVVPDVQRSLPGLTGGQGVWSSRPEGDRPVPGPPPRRDRTDGNPVDRVEYLRFLARRPPSTGRG